MLDFWNDPRRWDGIDDPHKTMFWEVRRPDIIDVRPKVAKPVQAPEKGLQHADYSNALTPGKGLNQRLPAGSLQSYYDNSPQLSPLARGYAPDRSGLLFSWPMKLW